MPRQVLINGSGLAACCCASLLRKSGYRVRVIAGPLKSTPVLMLSHQTQRLLQDVFGCADLFADAIQVVQRVVRWGQAKQPVVLPHAGLVISESALLDRIWPTLELESEINDPSNTWVIHSLKTGLESVSHHDFGSRSAVTNLVELSNPSCVDSCWVESVRSGWLFLIPCGGENGSLISVGDSAEVLLTESRLIAEQVTAVGESKGSFAARPRIITPLCNHGWIACGTAAMAFDPIAGEGAGNALREGILASAVIQAINNIGDEAGLLAHYSARLLSGFLRHLQDCCRFYESVTGPWWEMELEQMRQGISWSQSQIDLHFAQNPTPLFRLRDFHLERIPT